MRNDQDGTTPADDHRRLIDRIDRTIDALRSERTRLDEALARLDPGAGPAGEKAADRDR